MNNFKQGMIYTGLILLCTLTTLGNSAAAQNPFEDLIDNRFAGFFSGGGIGYGITRQEDGSASSSAALIQWKVGYAVSKTFGLYVTSIFADVEPKFGFIWFPKQEVGTSNQRYFLLASIGYYGYKYDPGFNTLSVASVGGNTLSTNGGFGYEFRPHFMFEATVGYDQTRFDVWGASSNYNVITLIASVNYLFY